MDRFRELTTFCAVAEAGAFNAAARQLNMSPPAVTRQVSALEQRIEAKLFTRTTRSVRLTEAGERFFIDAQRVLADLQQAEAVAAGAHQMPRGELRVTAPILFGQQYIMPIVRDFLDQHPGVTISTMFVDRIVHLVEEGVDLALRIGQLDDSSLYAVRTGSVRRVVVASPRYVEQFGFPPEPAGLVDHRIVSISNLAGSGEWQFVAGGKTTQVRTSPRLTVNSITAGIDAAVSGWGITRVLSYQVASAIENGLLVEILSPFEDREIPVQIVYPDGPRAPAKIRAFAQFATATLRNMSSRLYGNAGR